MSPRLTELAGVAADEWDAVLAASGSPFRFSQTAAAGRALERAFESYAFTPYRARYDDGTSLLFPLVRVNRRLRQLSMLQGMPLGLEGTPVARHGAATGEHLDALFTALPEAGSLTIHGGAGGSPPAAGEVTQAETHVLDLRSGFDAIWNSSFTAKTRNVCRKAEREGVEVELADAASAAEYYELYAKAAARWTDGARHPRELFVALAESGSAELWLGRLDGRLVAGALLLRGSHDALYWSGAMDREYGRLAPSNAVLRSAIESCCERGLSYFDFGASGSLSGVAAFKKSFGAQPREYSSVTLSTRSYRTLEASRRGMSGGLGRVRRQRSAERGSEPT